ncbi:IS110 family transposase [Burkholderia stagnalis]|uniref:IS110 family transposase n=1 Tax=Burkholderia stagnalis TaxID=1503054 RepID=UPI00075439D5|nr:IS110 family transposase [Burkholderia stagnalis]KWI26308.1 hypothetical protein WT71_19810 [Burkholderia stagnalis]KWI71345.1 hypothetical protein WT73_00795 [Burkholderia stagnalis]MDY7807246.1 IS110 family transposase [Burkholderia stagnalis]
MSDTVFVGIDVSSQTLEVAISTQTATWQATNDTTGIEQLTSQLTALKPELIVLEATGGYEFEAACALRPRLGRCRDQPSHGARLCASHGRAG